jgi:hypothetical protein
VRAVAVSLKAWIALTKSGASTTEKQQALEKQFSVQMVQLKALVPEKDIADVMRCFRDVLVAGREALAKQPASLQLQTEVARSSKEFASVLGALSSASRSVLSRSGESPTPSLEPSPVVVRRATVNSTSPSSHLVRSSSPSSQPSSPNPSRNASEPSLQSLAVNSYSDGSAPPSLARDVASAMLAQREQFPTLDIPWMFDYLMYETVKRTAGATDVSLKGSDCCICNWFQCAKKNPPF